MRGSIREITSERISEQTEEAIADLLKMKMITCAKALVKVIRSLELEYGQGAVEVAKKTVLAREPRPASELGTPEGDLRIFCGQLEAGCIGSHVWERVVDKPDQVGYRFRRCLWAEIFNELHAQDIGRWLCEGDEPSVRSFNPRLGLSLTKTLMNGDSQCNHVFFVKG